MVRDEEMNSLEDISEQIINMKFWMGVSFQEMSKYSQEIKQYKQKLAEAEKNLESAKAGLDENLMNWKNLVDKMEEINKDKYTKKKK